MYAHRQIYDHVQDSVPVPEQMRHQRVEVIFMALDEEPASAQNMTGIGTQMASFFRDIPPATHSDEEFMLPAKEYPPAMTFE
jgi:hypothetical protein